MSAAILRLYRSAGPNFHADWGAAFTGPAKREQEILMRTAAGRTF
ncbi:hypothetical protein ACTMTF_16845 [Nonomuraea sp. ZG12]